MNQVLLAGDHFITEDVLRAAATRHLPESELTFLESGFPEEPFRSVGGVSEATGDEDALIRALAGRDAVIAHTHPFTRRVFECSPGLKVVAICRGGPVNLDLAAAAEHGVTVTFVPGRNAVATAEQTVALILASARQVAQRHVEVASGSWGIDNYRYDKVGPELAGGNLALIGYGAVGSRVARACEALGMHIMVYDPYFNGNLPPSYEFVPELDALLSRAQVVTLHARATAETQGMIGRRELALIPEGGILINCARGTLLDYSALQAALKSGHLFAAGLDVFHIEPLPKDDPLLSTPHLTMSPHIAGASRQSAHFSATVAAQDVARYFRGETPLHVATP